MFSIRKISAIVALGMMAACVSVGAVGAGILTTVPSEQSNQSSEDVVKEPFWIALAAIINAREPSARVSLRSASNYSSQKGASKDKDEGRNCPIPIPAVPEC